MVICDKCKREILSGQRIARREDKFLHFNCAKAAGLEEYAASLEKRISALQMELEALRNEINQGRSSFWVYCGGCGAHYDRNEHPRCPECECGEFQLHSWQQEDY